MNRLILGIQPVREAIRVHKNAISAVLIDENKLRTSHGHVADNRTNNESATSPSPIGPNQSTAPKDSQTLQRLAHFAKQCGINVVPTPRSHLDSITKNATHQGVLAYAPHLVIKSLHEIVAASLTLVVCLDRINDPQNFGAIIRSSVALQANAIVWPEHDSAPLSPATFRASAGAVEHASLCRVPALPSALQTLQTQPMQVVGLAGDASTFLHDLDLRQPTVLVIGAEGSGLRKSVRNACCHLAKLPTAPPLTTLNASVSAAIALYEVRRQRM